MGKINETQRKWLKEIQENGLIKMWAPRIKNKKVEEKVRTGFREDGK